MSSSQKEEVNCFSSSFIENVQSLLSNLCVKTIDLIFFIFTTKLQAWIKAQIKRFFKKEIRLKNLNGF